MSRPTIAQRYPCIFAEPLAHEIVDPAVKEMFKTWGQTPKWGDLRKTWRQRHCATLNPYGSEDCPFTKGECGVAFLNAVEETLRAHPDNVMALFRFIARRTGAQRADDAQGSRHTRRLRERHLQRQVPEMAPTPHPVQHRSGDGHEGVDGHVEGGTQEFLRRPNRRPTWIGSMFRKDDAGSRPQPRRRDEGEAGTE